MNNNDIIYMENFRQNLVSLINNSGLSIGNAYYVFKTVYNDLQGLYDNALKESFKQMKEPTEEEENKIEKE